MKTRLLIHGSIVFLILFAACLPLFSVAIAGEIASANDCQLDEGSIHPCIVNGRDIGQSLYTMGMMGWLMLATIPIGLGLAGIYIILVAGFYILRSIMRSRATEGKNRTSRPAA